MTCKGDLAAAMANEGFTANEARKLLLLIFEHAQDPNFAQRYQEWEDYEGTDGMNRYWNVIRFLKEMV